MREPEAAILVRRARKQYTPQGQFILDDLNMTVMSGTIYGLLGASGCGKTTLLSSIVGTRNLQGGVISIFGQPPGKTAVKSIGYMPQDLALVGEFTVKGALEHYGWIFGMRNEEIDERFNFLSKLLDLPPADRLVKNLSGGQQRRVSLAVVLVHNPKLLILDEPTVGLDPVLRQNIWDYLVKITETENKSVIITTHYIEEASQAHQLGLMRNGKILEEGAPQTLLSKYNCSTIENVFLLLSRRQQEGTLDVEGLTTGKNTLETDLHNLMLSSNFEGNSTKSSLWDRICFTNKGHAKALISKNFLRFKRHPGTLMFAFFFPLLEMFTFFLAIGKVPLDLKIGVVSEEIANYTDCREYRAHNWVGGHLLQDNETCVYSGLTCKFIDNLGETFKAQVYFNSIEEALGATKRGEIHTFIHFSRNFSQAVTRVRNDIIHAADIDLDFRDINIYRDVIDHTLSEIFRKELYDTYKRYAESLAIDCDTNPHAERVPMKFNDPIYGSDKLTYRDLIAPGMIALVAVFLTMGISTSAITTERTEGIWERTIVSGVTPAEILIFHTITLCCVSIIQILEILSVTFIFFDLECKGAKWTVFLLIYIQSIAGICFGISISVVTRNMTEANYASLGLFYPFLTLTGCFWPIEGMPNYLRYISYLVPLTVTSQSLANVIHRGWGIGHFQVVKSILTSIGFICFFTLVSLIVLRQEKKR